MMSRIPLLHVALPPLHSCSPSLRLLEVLIITKDWSYPCEGGEISELTPVFAPGDHQYIKIILHSLHDAAKTFLIPAANRP